MYKALVIAFASLLFSFAAHGQSSKGAVTLLLNEQIARGATDTPELRKAIAADISRRDSLLLAAKKRGLDKDPTTKLQSEMARQNVIIQAYLTDWLSSNPISEQRLKSAYDVFLSTSGSTEYLVRDIWVRSEGDAKNAIARLENGEKFEQVAAQLTQDPGARSKGGLQNWAAVGFIDPAIAKTLPTLEKGAWFSRPILTQNGWHVIQLQDARPFTPPTYDSLRPNIKLDLEKKDLADHIKSIS